MLAWACEVLAKSLRRACLWYMMLLPQRLVLPVLDKTHCGGVNSRVFGQKCLEVSGKCVLRLDAVQQERNARQLRIEFVGREREVGQPVATANPSWHLWFDGIAAVPNS